MAAHDADFEGFQKISGGATSDYELQVDEDSDTELQAEDAMIYPKEDGNLPNIGYGSKMSCCDCFSNCHSVIHCFIFLYNYLKHNLDDSFIASKRVHKYWLLEFEQAPWKLILYRMLHSLSHLFGVPSFLIAFFTGWKIFSYMFLELSCVAIINQIIFPQYYLSTFLDVVSMYIVTFSFGCAILFNGYIFASLLFVACILFSKEYLVERFRDTEFDQIPVGSRYMTEIKNQAVSNSVLCSIFLIIMIFIMYDVSLIHWAMKK